MKKKRLKKGPIIILVILIIAVIAAVAIIKYVNYINSNPYKLEQHGYPKEEISYIVDNLEDEQIEKILNMEYNEKIIPLFKEKYFLYKHLDNYLKYMDDNEEVDYKTTVLKINTNTNKDYYTDIKKTDVSKNELMLLNKYNALDENYKPTDIITIPNQYAYEGHKIKKNTYDNFLNMWNAAKKEGYTLIVNSSYRTYKDQKDTYKYFEDIGGDEYADGIAARPGHSEHQTGYALDIVTYNTSGDDFDKTKAFKWLKDNAHKYGFILRYPKNKENITGYKYESWHYRYVGVQAATKIYEENITFDEYYAYYVDK